MTRPQAYRVLPSFTSRIGPPSGGPGHGAGPIMDSLP